ncbi:MAG: hypothetical protein CMK59_08810 [Proteobacteria bacterium]|nr:hypothetical protein [Pseudomonadota bacterium]
MKAYLALPEDDGSFAFVLEFLAGHENFVFFGFLGPDPQEEAELRGESYIPDMERDFRGAHLLNQSMSALNLPYEFTAVPVGYLHAILRKGQLLWEERYSKVLLDEEYWQVICDLLPSPKANLLDLPTIPEPQAFEQLLSPKEGVCVAIPDSVLFEGMGGIALTKHNMNHSDAAVELLPVVIDTTADLAAQRMFMSWWSLALEVVALISDAKDSPALANAARYNGALMDTAKGSVIPLLRAWTEHFLIRATAMARIVERQRVKGLKDKESESQESKS